MKVFSVSWRILIACIFALATTAVLAGQELPGSIKGFKKETLEVYFNRADLERENSAWERVARFGAEAAVSLWEREASDLYTDPDQIAQARAQLSGWVGTQMHERYEAWLTRRFFDRQGSLGSEAVLRAITDADLQYLYTTDDAGNIVLDESGDPVLRGATGVEADRAGWRAHVASATDEVIAAWESRVDAAFAPELGGLLGPEALAKYGEFKGSLEAGLRREMERVALQGELSLTARRLYDQYSLRKKSESATADAIADQIVRETQAQTDEGIEQIKSGLALSPDSVDSSVPSIDVQQWLESFKAAFEKGLSKWDAAEEKFLTSRMEWERDAGKSYKEGEAAWSAAFERLGTERRAWEQKVDTLLQSGKSKWDGEQSQLAAAIDTARSEFQKERNERLGGMQDRVGALVDMYAQSVQVISTAVASGQELIQKLNIRGTNGEYVIFSKDAVTALTAWRTQTWGKYVSSLLSEIGAYTQAKSSLEAQIQDLEEARLETREQNPMFRDAYDNIYYEKEAPLKAAVLVYNNLIALRVPLFNQMRLADASGPVQGENPALNLALVAYENFLTQTAGNSSHADAVQTAWERMSRMGDWLNMIDTYTAQADKAKEGLEDVLGSAFGSQIADLRDVITTDPAAGVAYLDEYQLELIRAKAIEDYWKQKKAIADSVVAYAQDISSGRETSDTGDKKYNAAKVAYETRLDEYEAAVKNLKDGGAGLAAARQALQAAQAAADEASAAYEQARQEYVDVLVSTQSGTVDFYRGQIEQKYKDLLDASGMSGSDTWLTEASTVYFAAARRHGFDLAIDSAWQSAVVLVKGDPESGLAPLADLKSTAERIRVPEGVDRIPSSIDDLGVPIDAPDYANVSALFIAWRDAPSGDAQAVAGAKLLKYLGLLAVRADAAYQERLAEVLAYGAVDAASWYSESGGTRSDGSVEDRLSADNTVAALALVTSRARAEKRGLQAWLELAGNGSPSDQDALMLAKSAQTGLDQAEALHRVSELDALLNALDGAVDTAAATTRLREMTSTGAWIQAFVSGRGTFVNAQAGDLSLALCLPQYRESERARRIQAVWSRASGTSPALTAERESESLEAVKKAFADRGLSVPENAALPSAEDVTADTASLDAQAAARFVVELGGALWAATAEGPRWLEDRVNEYCEALSQYAAADAVRKGAATGAAGRSAAAEAAASQAAASQADFDRIAQGLQGIGRFASLVELYARPGAPSPSASAAKDLIVNDGAAETAKQFISDPSVPLRTIAAGLAAGMSATLADSIAARAAELLATNDGASVEGQRISAYRTWSTVTVAQTVSGISASVIAPEAMRLWEEVASHNWSTQEGLDAALRTYLEKFDTDHPAPQEIIVLCEGLASGYEDRESLFRRVLLGDDFDSRLASIRSLGEPGAVYERAIALTLAAHAQGADDSEQSALAAFLRDRAGVGFAGDAPEFAGKTFDLEAEAFAGAGALAAEYRGKVLLSQGLPIPDDLMTILSASPASLAMVSAFKNTMMKARGYLGALDGSPENYAEDVAGGYARDIPAMCSLIGSISIGQWDDAFFAAISTDNYLDWYKAIAAASLDGAASVAMREIAEKSMSVSHEVAVDQAEAAYWTYVADQADAPASWRDYLSDANVGAGVTITTAASAETRDGEGYARSAAGAKDNPVLEAFNGLARAEAAFAAQLAVDGVDTGAIARFHDFLSAFSAGTAQENDLPADAVSSLNSDEANYRSALARVDSLKEDISRSGQALAFLDLGTEERQAQLESLQAAVEGLRTEVQARQSDVDMTLTGFESNGQSYNALLGKVQESSDILEQARFNLRAREEIQDWAASGYLAASGEVAADYQSPAERQKEAADQLVRATAAKDALAELFGAEVVTERPIEDTATLAAYDIWKEKYAALMRLERVSGDLALATEAQAKKVEELGEALQKTRGEFLDCNVALGSIKDFDASDRAGSWGSYLTVRNGKLELSIDDSFVLTSQGSQEAVQEVRDFFQQKQAQPDGTEKSSFELAANSWVASMEKLAAQYGGMDTLINRWGFAADWLRRRLYDSNGTAIQGLLSDYASNNSFVGINKWLNLQIAGENHSDDVQAYIAEAVSFAQAQYGSVMANAEEKEAFELYFAMRMAGGKSTISSQFESRTSERVVSSISALADSRYQHYRRLARQHGIFAGVMGSRGDRNAAEATLNEVNNKLYSLRILRDGNKVLSAIGATKVYDAAFARLAELQGSNGAPLDSLTAFIDQYKKVAAERQGTTAAKVNVPAELLAQFNSGWAQLKAEDKSSFSKALARMTLCASLDTATAEQKVSSALVSARTRVASAQQEYWAAYDAYIAGSGSKDAFVEAAARAYKNAQWAAKAEHELSSDVLDEASFSGGALLNAAEAQARMGALQKYAQSVLAAYAGALDARGAKSEQDWTQSVQDLGDQRQSWYAQVGLVRAKAASAWASSQEKLGRALVQWRQGFQQEYAEKSEAWRMAYLNMGESKLGWVAATREKAAQAGNEAILSEVGASAEDGSRNAGTLLVGGMSYDAKEATVQVEGLLGEVGSAQALTALRRMNAGIGSGESVVARAGLSVDTSGARIAAEARRFVAQSRSELSALAARGLADDARASVEEAKKALAESVKQANEGFEISMDDTFSDAGYAKSGGVYARETIMRSTFFDTVTENLRVSGYVWYAMPALQLKVDLSQGRLSGLEAGAVMDLVGAAQEEVGSAQKRIFGEGKELSEEQKKAKGLLVEFSANDTTVKKELGEGEFGGYIGYAPEFTDEPDFDKSQKRNIVVSGKGELGRLMGDFIWNEMRESRGWTELAAPRWDKPLWDDTGSWFKAPNLRSVGSIAAGIAAAVLVPGGGAMTLGSILGSAAVSTSSTVLFDSLDVVYGYKTWEEAGLDVGKGFLTSSVTSTVGGVFNGFDPKGATSFLNQGISGALGDFGKGAIGKALVAGAQSFTTNTATSAINAFNWSDGGLGWDTNAFMQGSFGMGAWGSVAGTAGAAGTSTLLAGNLTGFSALHSQDVVSVSNLAGGLASSGIQYGMTGEATLNVLNLADLGSNSHYGLMEMHLGGDQGFGMNVGSNGTDMSVGTIGRAMAGMGTFVKQQQFNYYEAVGGVQYAADYTGSREVGTQLRENYSFGDQAAQVQLARFLSGQDNLRVGYIGNEGQTTAVGESRVVDLATLGQKGNIASQLAAGTVMQHEAHRNGVYDGVLGQEYETQRAVTGHTEMALRVAKEYGRGFIAQNAKLSQDVAEYVKGPESFARYVGDTYDSSVDYWKLKRNGDLINDGDGWLKDENGRYILDNQGNRVGAKGIETGLTKILGLDPSNAADVSRVQQLMMDSGMVHSNAGNAAAWMWGGSANAPIAEQFSSLGVAGIQSLSLDEANKDKTIISSTLLADFGDTVVAPLLMNGLDTISDLAVLGGSGAEALARTVVPGKALDRYDEYVADKRGFYFGQHVLLGDTQSAHVSLEYGPSDLPAHNGQHKGTDIADTVGTAISAFYGGKVVFSDSTVSAGNTVIIANGFNFEGFFYDTGVQSQFMHLLSPSAMQQGDSVSGRTFVGNMGYSGDVDPFGVAGTHLHYQLMGDLGGQGLDPTSVEWDMYRNRRDTFLSLVGSRPMWDYSVLPTSTQNYWSQNYSNFYFDSNEVMRRLGISAAR